MAIVFLAMWGWRELGIRAARETVVSQDAEIMRLSAENARLRDRSQRLSNEIAALTSKDTRSISLAGQSVAPGASAKIFIEPARHRAVAFFYGLPANPSDKRYQLWIIRIDQPNPQNAGAFDVNGSGSASIIVENPPATTKIKTLAVTLETRGGVPRPTSTNYYLIGKP